MNLDSITLPNLQSWTRWNVKADGWIKPDLSISTSSWIGRFFWKIVGKHFAFIRKFYEIDLQQSQTNLLRYRVEILKNLDENQIAIFNPAANKFSKAFPKYLVPEIQNQSLIDILEEKTDKKEAFVVFQKKANRLKSNCSYLEKRYSKLIDNSNCVLKKIEKLRLGTFSLEDHLLLNLIEDDFNSVKKWETIFSKKKE